MNTCTYTYQPGHLGTMCYGGMNNAIGACQNHTIKAVTVCECDRTWYMGDRYDKTLTWANKYYCTTCHPKKEPQEKLAILRAIPCEVLRIMIDEGYLKNSRVTDTVWNS